MIADNTPLAKALKTLKKIQSEDKRVIFTKDIDRVDREILVENGWLTPVIKGWYISTHPSVRDGDTTPWTIAFWEFISRYLSHRFKDDWWINADLSAELLTGSTILPRQVLACSPNGDRNRIELPGGQSIFVSKVKEAPSEIVELHGLRLMSLPAAVAQLPPVYFTRDQNSVNTALLAISQSANSPELRRILLRDNMPVVSGRIIGALRHIGRENEANEISETLKGAGQKPIISNPFDSDERKLPLLPANPYVGRLKLQWDKMRLSLDNYDIEDVAIDDVDAFMEQINNAHVEDAYHSLSIEGYNVTEKMIDQISRGEWNPEANAEDQKNRDAMAAKGYHDAFQSVKEAIRIIHSGEDPVAVINASYGKWYRDLFGPSVRAGLIKRENLAGFRNGPIFIRGSRHVPPGREAVPPMITAMFDDMLSQKMTGFSRAVLAHYYFVFIHPYYDGNGRISRFLMNSFLASGGHNWLIIKKEDRDEYFEALERARIEEDIGLFAEFVRERISSTPASAPQMR